MRHVHFPRQPPKPRWRAYKHPPLPYIVALAFARPTLCHNTLAPAFQSLPFIFGLPGRCSACLWCLRSCHHTLTRPHLLYPFGYVWCVTHLRVRLFVPFPTPYRPRPTKISPQRSPGTCELWSGRQHTLACTTHAHAPLSPTPHPRCTCHAPLHASLCRASAHATHMCASCVHGGEKNA